MKTEKEMIAFRQGYKLDTNIVSQTLKMAKTIKGCQDEVDVLKALVEALERNEEKKIKIANNLAEMCRKEEVTCVCPFATGDDCPFPEKFCDVITTKDWLDWMEENDD